MSVFITSFFTTAILLLLTNANTSQSILGVILPLSGSYTDLTAEWYNDVGASLITTMLFTAVWPLIEFSYTYFFKLLQRLLDSSCACRNQKKTKKKSI